MFSLAPAVADEAQAERRALDSIRNYRESAGKRIEQEVAELEVRLAAVREAKINKRIDQDYTVRRRGDSFVYQFQNEGLKLVTASDIEKAIEERQEQVEDAGVWGAPELNVSRLAPGQGGRLLMRYRTEDSKNAYRLIYKGSKPLNRNVAIATFSLVVRQNGKRKKPRPFYLALSGINIEEVEDELQNRIFLVLGTRRIGGQSMYHLKAWYDPNAPVEDPDEDEEGEGEDEEGEEEESKRGRRKIE